LIRNKKILHATEKSEAIACCKEMPFIPVNRVVDRKRMIGKNAVQRRRRGTTVADPKK
jgi:hypothetical protein